MKQKPQVYNDPIDIGSRLGRLGLSVDLIHEVRIAGRIASASCTENDPPSFPGYTRWGVMTRELRNLLMPRGWHKSDAANFSIVFSPDRSFCLVVATGDEQTGNPHKNPTTKYPKGSQTIQAVTRNREQIEAFPIETISTIPTDDYLTWVLLVRYHTKGDRAELSLPYEIRDDGLICEWSERIILPAIPWDDGEGEGLPMRVPEPGPEFDVHVERRAG